MRNEISNQQGDPLLFSRGSKMAECCTSHVGLIWAFLKWAIQFMLMNGIRSTIPNSRGRIEISMERYLPPHISSSHSLQVSRYNLPATNQTHGTLDNSSLFHSLSKSLLTIHSHTLTLTYPFSIFYPTPLSSLDILQLRGKPLPLPSPPLPKTSYSKENLARRKWPP